MLLTDSQVFAKFGYPTPYVRANGSIDDAWATAQFELPAPLPVNWDRAHSVSRLRVHRKLVGAFRTALGAVHAKSGSLGEPGRHQKGLRVGPAMWREAAQPAPQEDRD